MEQQLTKQDFLDRGWYMKPKPSSKTNPFFIGIIPGTTYGFHISAAHEFVLTVQKKGLYELTERMYNPVTGWTTVGSTQLRMYKPSHLEANMEAYGLPVSSPKSREPEPFLTKEEINARGWEYNWLSKEYRRYVDKGHYWYMKIHPNGQAHLRETQENAFGESKIMVEFDIPPMQKPEHLDMMMDLARIPNKLINPPHKFRMPAFEGKFQGWGHSLIDDISYLRGQQKKPQTTAEHLQKASDIDKNVFPPKTLNVDVPEGSYIFPPKGPLTPFGEEIGMFENALFLAKNTAKIKHEVMGNNPDVKVVTVEGGVSQYILIKHSRDKVLTVELLRGHDVMQIHCVPGEETAPPVPKHKILSEKEAQALHTEPPREHYEKHEEHLHETAKEAMPQEVVATDKNTVRLIAHRNGNFTVLRMGEEGVFDPEIHLSSISLDFIFPDIPEHYWDKGNKKITLP